MTDLEDSGYLFARHVDLLDDLVDAEILEVLDDRGHGQAGALELRSFAGEKQTGTFERVEPFSPSPGQLRAYAGVYASDELNVEWTIAEQGSTLVIRRRGNADTVIEPLAIDMFTTVGDFMKFSRDARGTITGFTLVSTGARSLRFERVNR